MNGLLYKLNTVLRLGICNTATVTLYKRALHSGLAEKFLPTGDSNDQPLFNRPPSLENTIPTFPSGPADINDAKMLLEGNIRYFSNESYHLGSPPDWFKNPFNSHRLSDIHYHWSRINDFIPEIGDIKAIWEASRFDWAIIFAKAFQLTGDGVYLDTLNQWIKNWTTNNPLNTGPNWKCGQESGIRMLQVLLAAFLLKQHTCPSLSLIRFVKEHCSRIAPTILYAIAQDNNHGTSEAAALFIGGAWLDKVATEPSLQRKGLKWKNRGRYWLENRIARLVEDEGSFSQYSLNYHRVLVDSLNIVEFWRRQLGLRKFSKRFYARCRAAVDWLYCMVDPETGDGPNIGSNDGARLFALSTASYRDYRPSIQLGSVLFCKKKLYPPGSTDDALRWFEIEDSLFKGPAGDNRKSKIFPKGGYVFLKPESTYAHRSWGVVRYPNFRFRPSHADALHFDLWYNGINLLRDSGSFSYNTENQWLRYFPGTESHNTIQFDGRDQMPRLGRFLFGEWLCMDDVGRLESKEDFLSWSGAYTDYKGARHKRTIVAEKDTWQISDEISGFVEKAVLRWRLAPGNWELKGTVCKGRLADLKIEADNPISRVNLTEGWESRYYMERSELPVLEVEVNAGKTVLNTEIRLK